MTPTPEEPPQEGSAQDDSGSTPSGSDASLRGWIDPDDRLWRHPSELARRAEPVGTAHRNATWRSRTMVLIGAAAAVAAVAWVAVLLSPASDQPPPAASDSAADVPVTTLAVHSAAVPARAEAAGHSVVQLRAETDHGVVSLVGVAVAEGGLVVTTADELSGLRSLSMIGSGGRRLHASVLAVDNASDVALVSVPDDIPVAQFADDNTLNVGSIDMTLSVAASDDDASMSLNCADGTVTGVGTVIESGWAKGMPAITSSGPSLNQEPGDPLLNQAGAVIGLLYSPGPSPTFLPSQLVLGVADDLRSTGRVSHGWLGVEGATAPGSGGARVAALMAGSPATGLLQPGDVVVALGSLPIRSMADLRGRLYVLAPDSTVGLSVLQGSTTHLVDVTLSAAP